MVSTLKWIAMAVTVLSTLAIGGATYVDWACERHAYAIKEKLIHLEHDIEVMREEVKELRK